MENDHMSVTSLGSSVSSMDDMDDFFDHLEDTLLAEDATCGDSVATGRSMRSMVSRKRRVVYFDEAENVVHEHESSIGGSIAWWERKDDLANPQAVQAEKKARAHKNIFTTWHSGKELKALKMAAEKEWEKGVSMEYVNFMEQAFRYCLQMNAGRNETKAIRNIVRALQIQDTLVGMEGAAAKAVDDGLQIRHKMYSDEFFHIQNQQMKQLETELNRLHQQSMDHPEGVHTSKHQSPFAPSVVQIQRQELAHSCQLHSSVAARWARWTAEALAIHIQGENSENDTSSSNNKAKNKRSTSSKKSSMKKSTRRASTSSSRPGSTSTRSSRRTASVSPKLSKKPPASTSRKSPKKSSSETKKTRESKRSSSSK